MKQFAYYRTDAPRDRAGNPKDTVTVIHIAHNMPTVLGTAERGYRTPEQAAVDIAIGAGKIGAAHIGKTAARLFNDGIANFTHI